MAFFHKCEPEKSQGFSEFAAAASSGGSLYPRAANAGWVEHLTAARCNCLSVKLLATIDNLRLVESSMHNPAPLNPTPRPSRCLNRSRELERERIERLSVEERIRLAIGLKERLARLLPVPSTNDPNAAST